MERYEDFARDQSDALEERMQNPPPDLAARPEPVSPPPEDAAARAGYTGERVDNSTYGGESYDKDWDPAWERRARELLGDEVVGGDKELFSPAHRRRINKLMGKKKREQRAAAGKREEVAVAEAEPETGGVDEPPAPGPGAETGGMEPLPPEFPPAMQNNQVKPRVLAGGRLPGGEEIFRTTAGPWGSGWIPAGNGLWWPPYPVTGGPVSRPNMPQTLDAEGQANALERG